MKGLFLKDIMTSKKIVLGSIGISFIILLSWNLIFQSVQNRSVFLFIQLCELILIGMILNVMLLVDDKTSKFSVYSKVIPISNKIIIAEKFIFAFIINFIYIIAGLITLIIVDKGKLNNTWWMFFIILPVSIIVTAILNMLAIIFDNKIVLIIFLAIYPLVILSFIAEKWNNPSKDTIFYEKKAEIVVLSFIIYLICYISTVLIDNHKEYLVYVLKHTRLAFIIIGITLICGLIMYIINLDVVYKAKIDKTYAHGLDNTYYIDVTNIEYSSDRKENDKTEKKFNKFYKDLVGINGLNAAGYYNSYGFIDKKCEFAKIIDNVQKEENYVEYTLKGEGNYVECINMSYSTFNLFNIEISDGLLSEQQKRYKSDKYKTIFVYLGSGYSKTKGLKLGDTYTYDYSPEYKVKYVIAGILEKNSSIVDDFIMWGSNNDMKNPIKDLEYSVICINEAQLDSPLYISLDSNISTKQAFKKVNNLASEYDYKINITNMNEVVNEIYEETIIDDFMHKIISPFL